MEKTLRDILDIKVYDSYIFGQAISEYSQIDIPLLAQYLYHSENHVIKDCHATNAEICIQLCESSAVEQLLDLKIDISNIPIPSKDKIVLEFDPDKGNDWSHIEAHVKITRQQYIDLLERLDFRLCMYGFLPGFCYLTGLPKSMQIPRSSKPKRKIKAKTLALGGEYIGIYGIDSPGGWIEIGECNQNLLDFNSENIHRLPIGQIINFKSI